MEGITYGQFDRKLETRYSKVHRDAQAFRKDPKETKLRTNCFQMVVQCLPSAPSDSDPAEAKSGLQLTELIRVLTSGGHLILCGRVVDFERLGYVDEMLSYDPARS